MKEVFRNKRYAVFVDNENCKIVDYLYLTEIAWQKGDFNDYQEIKNPKSPPATGKTQESVLSEMADFLVFNFPMLL